MERRKTVFIVGAGASREFGLPTGRELLTQISRLARIERDSRGNFRRVHVDDKIEDSLLKYAQREGLHQSADIQRLRMHTNFICKNASLAPSIDNFLNTHKNELELVAVGKLLIAHCLLEAERNSSLASSNEDDMRDFKFFSEPRYHTPTGGKTTQLAATESWLGQLFWLLAEENDYAGFCENLAHFSFVCFNYDRCIEHFLVNAAISYFGIDTNAASFLLRGLNIIRPYGSLGNLSVKDHFAYGFGPRTSDELQVSENLRTFTEGVQNDSIKQKIQGCLTEANQVLFLGFGFHSLNMELLNGPGTRYDVGFMSGTCKGLSKGSQEIVAKQLREGFFARSNGQNRSKSDDFSYNNQFARLMEVTCFDLLWNHHSLLRAKWQQA